MSAFVSENFSSGVDKSAYDERWEAGWKSGLAPKQAFDAAQPSPLLSHLLSTSSLSVQGKRVLIPGCGRGYDLVAFASSGASQAVGLEISPTAQKSAYEYFSAQLEHPNESASSILTPPPPHTFDIPIHARLSAEVHGTMSVLLTDFLSWDASSPSKAEECVKDVAEATTTNSSSPLSSPFDVGYDYTCFCALHPSMRGAWAASWARNVKSGGELVTLIFPIKPEADPNVGPPFPVTPQLYQQYLIPAGFIQKTLEPVPEHLSHPGREGKEWLGRWIRA